MRRTPDSLRKLVEALKKLPAVGEKTAERFAFFLVHAENGYVEKLIQALREVKAKVKLCQRCFDITEEPLCSICRDARRDSQLLCVVERPDDVRAMEATGQYHGLYHVLHGSVSPLEGTGPESLKVEELLRRLVTSAKEGEPAVTEVILATNHNVEGDATTHLLAEKIQQQCGKKIRLTRLASGMPIGGALAYADQATLTHALTGRSELR